MKTIIIKRDKNITKFRFPIYENETIIKECDGLLPITTAVIVDNKLYYVEASSFDTKENTLKIYVEA